MGEGRGGWVGSLADGAMVTVGLRSELGIGGDPVIAADGAPDPHLLRPQHLGRRDPRRSPRRKPRRKQTHRRKDDPRRSE